MQPQGEKGGPSKESPVPITEDQIKEKYLERAIRELNQLTHELQDCEAQGTLSRLAERAAALAGDALRIGYNPLAEWAEAVQRAATERNAQDTRKALLELTEVAYRVRLGHRGAV